MEHKFTCRLGRPIDEADHLVRFCQRQEYPGDDEDLATAFGFRHFISAVDRQILFRLYCTLVNVGGVGDEELRKAWRNNKLREFIIFRGSQFSPAVLAEKIEWLQKHETFGANSVTNFSRIMDTAKDVLDNVETDAQFDQLNSEIEKQAYLFYCQIGNGYIPSADEDNWLNLGFCTASRPDGSQQIVKLYRALVNRCKFGEFCRAMAESAMIELFSKYGLGAEIDCLRNFKTLMNSIAKWHQSVWELKRFTMLPDPEPMGAVIVDYGFKNCLDAQERIALRSVYAKFFSMGWDEMELHRACIEGRLAPFLEARLGQLSFPRERLSGYYPLEGCNYMGMVAKRVSLCLESKYQLICNLLRAQGDDSIVLAFPDDWDEEVKTFLRERAGYLTGSVVQEVKKMRFEEENVELISLSEARV
jgi:hypothetical protein